MFQVSLSFPYATYVNGWADFCSCGNKSREQDICNANKYSGPYRFYKFIKTKLSTRAKYKPRWSLSLNLGKAVYKDHLHIRCTYNVIVKSHTHTQNLMSLVQSCHKLKQESICTSCCIGQLLSIGQRSCLADEMTLKRKYFLLTLHRSIITDNNTKCL